MSITPTPSPEPRRTPFTPSPLTYALHPRIQTCLTLASKNRTPVPQTLAALAIIVRELNPSISMADSHATAQELLCPDDPFEEGGSLS